MYTIHLCNTSFTLSHKYNNIYISLRVFFSLFVLLRCKQMQTVFVVAFNCAPTCTSGMFFKPSRTEILNLYKRFSSHTLMTFLRLRIRPNNVWVVPQCD